ncbi:uncharacterized protein K441DRAFT_658534 [Cenococcum geophilum 1.58]|uniref:uncharacterized protein n=1 Tax=Cenococcum geophilum 1.58 TaxID=794803 RepID=UPI00358F0AAF|nr:hypothetical protein K441DRAFT_658534 [Cenococcum geophilum 1.58]
MDPQAIAKPRQTPSSRLPSSTSPRATPLQHTPNTPPTSPLPIPTTRPSAAPPPS